MMSKWSEEEYNSLTSEYKNALFELSKECSDSNKKRKNNLAEQFLDNLTLFPGSLSELRQFDKTARLILLPKPIALTKLFAHNGYESNPGIESLMEARVTGLLRVQMNFENTFHTFRPYCVGLAYTCDEKIRRF